MNEIIAGRLYKCPNCSLYVRVLRIYHTNPDKLSARLSFEYKNGMVVEVKNYRLKLENIQHWSQVRI